MHENDDGGALPAARGAAEQGVGLVEQRPRVVHQFVLPRLKLGVPRHALDSSIPIGKKHCYYIYTQLEFNKYYYHFNNALYAVSLRSAF